MVLNGKTDIGKRRKNNQDSFVIRDFGFAQLGLVCDGMGGANGGNIASALACETFTTYVENFMQSDMAKEQTATEGDYTLMLAHAVADANRAVYQCAQGDKSLKGMGSTLVAALVVGKSLYVVNVGDSRMYLYMRGKLTQITKDHSLVQYLLDNGKLTPEEAKTYPNRNVITRAVGIERNIEADVFSVDVPRDAGGGILLCSDGLSGYVENDCIVGMLETAMTSAVYDGEAAVSALIDAANHAGGIDNITVVLMHFQEKAKDSMICGTGSNNEEGEPHGSI